MTGYTKLFSSILDSSVWDYDSDTRVVWITLLAKSDRDGFVRSTINALARSARVDRAKVEEALNKFLNPDPDTLTSDYEGRRIERLEGGWRILNHTKYREMMSLEERRAYYARKQAEYRQRKKEAQSGLTAREIINERVKNGL